jgi:hypothetical protein
MAWLLSQGLTRFDNIHLGLTGLNLRFETVSFAVQALPDTCDRNSRARRSLMDNTTKLQPSTMKWRARNSRTCQSNHRRAERWIQRSTVHFYPWIILSYQIVEWNTWTKSRNRRQWVMICTVICGEKVWYYIQNPCYLLQATGSQVWSDAICTVWMMYLIKIKLISCRLINRRSSVKFA